MISRVTPLLLVALGVVALGAAGLVLRSFGPRFRVGRLLASTPQIPIDEARALAQQGLRRYVRVRGRIDSEQEFEDRDHRPLVLRRTRVASKRGSSWQTFEDGREQVPFELHEGLSTIEVDADALDVGLVVVPRISEGIAADLGDRAPDDVPPDAPVRITIEQVSSVEHAIGLGVPIAVGDRVTLTAGLGRPLVLTTLEPPEAMRLLTEGRTNRTRGAAALMVTGVAMLVVGFGWLIAEAVA
jgi:hypothetical protein